MHNDSSGISLTKLRHCRSKDTSSFLTIPSATSFIHLKKLLNQFKTRYKLFPPSLSLSLSLSLFLGGFFLDKLKVKDLYWTITLLHSLHFIAIMKLLAQYICNTNLFGTSRCTRSCSKTLCDQSFSSFTHRWTMCSMVDVSLSSPLGSSPWFFRMLRNFFSNSFCVLVYHQIH